MTAEFFKTLICQKFVDCRVHGILLGDNGYPQLPYLYTRILDHHVRTQAERRYNRANKSTRNIIERLNGVWKQRFPCLRRKLLTKAIATQSITIVCAVLHNIGILRRGCFENVEEGSVEAVPVANANVGQNATWMYAQATVHTKAFQFMCMGYEHILQRTTAAVILGVHILLILLSLLKFLPNLIILLIFLIPNIH